MNVVIYKHTAKEVIYSTYTYLIFIDTRGMIDCKYLHCVKIPNKKLSRKFLNKLCKDLPSILYHHNLPVYTYCGYDYLRMMSYELP